jgi:hypothetical protein
MQNASTFQPSDTSLHTDACTNLRQNIWTVTDIFIRSTPLQWLRLGGLAVICVH